ncbi:sacsin N-terminal ATP-binding-like domain-containing protein [Streptomonospora nanhaiensis]|uniref:sacsin N-terminal ATP-binding-like domain-containing protein n=1 Tax=Streptomonospora nanhaiensis TaxID=1323731 RepID=UPI001C993E90|nr:DEAD/DEAH box helicase family protein [Streptomonospora nanhaiensis]MBX9387564.1 DEAD/DEAH box helicase family protein [Streptomonospora nanhaiensis]
MVSTDENSRSSSPSGWATGDGDVARVVVERSESCLRSYEANPALIEEHANIERSITQGGYGNRQLYELIQNGADELQGEPRGRIHVLLTSDALYCANLGKPVTPAGAETILASHLSRKKGTEIGRFGVGFKSVLSISETPQFYSRSGSFGWRREDARRRIRERVPGDGPTPVLRLARVLDPDAERREDPVLDELMTWATTVVKLPLADTTHSIRLQGDMEDFPPVFAVFSPHVGQVILEERADDGTTTLDRRIHVRGQGDRRTLYVVDHNGRAGGPEEWRVFETVHTPSAHARQDAGEYHDRERIPLAWAVPVSGSREQQAIGRFWAFFPTTYETTLRGVLNAPWKTNEDRQNLLQGNRFNDELMEYAADLIVDSLPKLTTPEDPGLPLSLITARGRESRNWADKMLTELVYKRAAVRPSLPDQDGRLRPPSEINVHPAGLEVEWLRRWSSYPGRPTDWCHHTVEDVTRRSRVETILQRAKREASDVRTWLEALVSDGAAAASAVALAIAADMIVADHAEADQARQARILLTSGGDLVSPAEGRVFRRSALDDPTDDPTGDVLHLHPDLEKDPDLSAALDVLGVRESDDFGRFAAVVRRGLADNGPDEWRRFWALTRRVGTDRVVEHLADQRVTAADLRVYVRSGGLVPLTDCLLPGRVIPPGTDEDADLVVDEVEHRADIGLLRSLGMSDGPVPSAAPGDETWFREYRDAMAKRYYGALPPGAPRPRNVVVDGAPCAGPLGLLPRLSPEARARFLREVRAEGVVTEWTVHAPTRAGEEPLKVESPLVWMARMHGTLTTSLGLWPVDRCVGPGLTEFGRTLPVADVDPALADALRLPRTLDEIRGRLWMDLLERVNAGGSAVEAGLFYALAVRQLDAPAQLGCLRDGAWTLLPPTEIAVAADNTQFERLKTTGVGVVFAPDAGSAGDLVERWGMKAFADAYDTELRPTPLSESVPIEDVFPMLKFEPGRPLRHLSLVRCSALEQLVPTPDGRGAEPMDIGRAGDTVYWNERQDDRALLRALSGLLTLGLDDTRIDEVLRHREDARRGRLLAEVRSLPDPADKLVAMVGSATLRERLPRGLVDAVEDEEGAVDDHALGQLALAVHGPGVLREFRDELEQRGFDVPTQLAGGHLARAFVSDLGLPPEFAGFRQTPLDPVVTVEGPVDFPRLHDYQELMVGRVLEVLHSRPAKRGMLSLPTGAGKTRVAIEALIRFLRSLPDGAASVPVLWIAQTEELCEQAVQTWRFVWRQIGPARRLTISRLWSANEADPVDDGCHLVVATDAKLERVVADPGYAWLCEAQAVVVDEAHVSISPRYTQVLGALGLTRHRTRCPLVGLSATPFRGADFAEPGAETERLVQRYGRTRLDRRSDDSRILGEDPYAYLQDLGVLARVRHKELTGVTLDISEDERGELERLRRLPASAEGRLGSDATRNRMLLNEILALPEDWPILLFATSVAHAQIMAALLTRKGVPAAAVSGDTEAGVRRHTIERFRAGRIRVLANYGVLSQGFDAPATRAVIVARPTYSPNVYQQMIGRGLRGPLNGGKDECLIVNVADNIAQFGEELAFHRFEYLWSPR